MGALRQVYDPEGWTCFTEDEQLTMMSLWCIMRSPLMIGGEMTKFDDFTLKLLTNSEILRMHQNARASHPVYRRCEAGTEAALWTAFDAEGGLYAALFNLGEAKAELSFTAEDLEVRAFSSCKELWSGEELPSGTVVKSVIPAHGAKVYRIEA